MKTNMLLLLLSYLLSNQVGASQVRDFAWTKQVKTENSFDMLTDVNRKICLLYLHKYEEKDLKAIEEMFSDDIVLRDWKIRVVGKESALKETQKNFESVNSIKIEVLSIYEDKNTVAAELKITIDGKDELYVVDVITINAENKISSIRAYIGRGDALN